MNLQSIASATATHYGVTLIQMTGHSRRPDMTLPRHVYCHLARSLTQSSLPKIGKTIQRDHTTVLNSLKRVEKLNVAADLAAIEAELLFDFNSIPFTTRNTKGAE